MTARHYYNEIDKRKAKWLEQLIAAGVICAGDVDTRDIRDVRPSELAGYTQCHFFAGIGIWAYALRRVGWPDSRPVWTGSCPCGPFSEAGKRKGFDDERHLWPFWHHLIRIGRPGRVYGEQVASRDGLAWLDTVQPDMEGEEYAFAPFDLCAAGFGAPNRRQRLFFVADTNEGECSGLPDGQGGFFDWTPAGWVQSNRIPQSSGVIRRLADAAEAGPLSASLGRVRRGKAGAGPRDAEPERLRSVGDADSQGHEIRTRIGSHDAVEIREDQRQAALEAGFVRGWWSDARWIKCWDPDGERYRPIEPSTFPLAHGAAARVLRLCGYGDGINAETTAHFIKESDAAMMALRRAA